jgi:hypothetical protein
MAPNRRNIAIPGIMPIRPASLENPGMRSANGSWTTLGGVCSIGALPVEFTTDSLADGAERRTHFSAAGLSEAVDLDDINGIEPKER